MEETWQEQLKRLREEEAKKKQALSSSSQASSSSQTQSKPIKKTVQKPVQVQPSSSVAQNLPMPLAVQDATSPENTMIKDGSQGTGINPATIAGSFLFPLAMDEIETHGFNRPGILTAKGVGDAAMTTVPLSKGIAAGLKVANITHKLARPWTSVKAGERIIGQGIANAADNVVYTVAQAAADNREHDSMLAELGIGTALGFGTGALGGVKSYNASINAQENLAKKVRAKEGSKKQQVFEMEARREDEPISNLEQTAQIITEHPTNKTGLPATWTQMGKSYDNAIAAKRQEAAILAKNKNNQATTARVPIEVQATDGNLYPIGSTETRGVVINKPVFDNDAQENAWYTAIDNFLKKNNLGYFNQEGIIQLNDHVLPSDVENVLRKRRQGDFTAKGQKDWKEELRIAMRNSRGGDIETGHDWESLTRPANSYGEAMNQLERLHNQRQILNYAQGGFGFGAVPNEIGFKQMLKSSRPALSFYDLDLELMPRNITQAVTNLVDRKADIQEQVEKGKQAVQNSDVMQQLIDMGLDTPEKIKAYFESQGTPMPLTIR